MTCDSAWRETKEAYLRYEALGSLPRFKKGTGQAGFCEVVGSNISPPVFNFIRTEIKFLFCPPAASAKPETNPINSIFFIV